MPSGDPLVQCNAELTVCVSQQMPPPDPPWEPDPDYEDYLAFMPWDVYVDPDAGGWIVSRQLIDETIHAVAQFPAPDAYRITFSIRQCWVRHPLHGGDDLHQDVVFTYDATELVATCCDGTGHCQVRYAGGAWQDPSGTPEGGRASGPSAGDPVDPAGGNETYQPEPDLLVDSPATRPVAFRRAWQTVDALAGYASPGLGTGWVHNWDVFARPVGEPGTWGDLEVVLPVGAGERWTPVLDGAGQPTGEFTLPTGSPRVVTGVPAGTAGDWSSLTVTFADQMTWRLEPHSTGVYALVARGERTGQTVSCAWDSARRLCTVLDDQGGGALLHCTYDSAGYLAAVTDAYGREVRYRHEALGAGDQPALVGLIDVSQLAPAGGAAGSRWHHGYLAVPTSPTAGTNTLLLTSITKPSPTGEGTSTAWLRYYQQSYRVAETVDGNGNRTAWFYDPANHTAFVRHIAADGAILDRTDYTFNADGLLTSSTCGGCPSTIEYGDPANPQQPTRIVAGDGRVTTLTYDAVGNVTSVTDPRGVVWTYTYAYTAFALGRLTQVDRTADSTTVTLAAYTYFEPTGLVHTATALKPGATDGSTVVTTYTYDSLGNVLTVVSPGNDAVASMTTTWNYTSDGSYTASARRGQPLTVTDNLGHTTHFRYDERGNRTEVADALGHTWRSRYNLADQRVLRQQPGEEPADIVVDGSVTPVLAVALTRVGLPGVILELSATATLRSWPEGQEQPGEAFTLSLTPLVPCPLTYGTLALSAALPAGRYRLDGVMVSAVTGSGTWNDENQWTAELETRDAAMALVEVLTTGAITSAGASLVRLPALPLATEHVYLYPGGPNTELRVLDQHGLSVQQIFYRYGPEGELLQVSGGTEPVTYGYDALYRQTSLTDGNGHTTQFAYDGKGRLKLIRYPLATADEGDDTVRFPLYDDAGRLLQRIDGNDGVTNYTYAEAGGALTAISYPSDPTRNVSFGYDALGRRISMANGEASHTYTYGADGRPLSETVTYTGLPAKTVSRTYYDDGSRATLTTPAGTHTSGYDGAGRQTSLVYGLGTASWTWLDNDLLSRAALPNCAYTDYTYNGLNQLAELINRTSAGVVTTQYTDLRRAATGDLLSHDGAVPTAPSLSGLTRYAYDAQRRLLRQANTQLGGRAWDWAYDAAGNLTRFDGQARTYNDDNQQTGPGTWVYDGNGNPTTCGGTALAFDLENRLTAYGTALTAGYRGDGLRAWKQTAAGRTYFLYDGIQVIAELDATGAVTGAAVFGAAGLLSHGATQYQFNPLGDVAVRLDAAGSVVSLALFDAWGTGLSGAAGPWGYRARHGYYTDAETGLVALAYRYYAPGLGRFVNRDPIRQRGGPNLYGYGADAPVSRVDPSGLYGWLVLACAVATYSAWNADVADPQLQPVGPDLQWGSEPGGHTRPRGRSDPGGQGGGGGGPRLEPGPPGDSLGGTPGSDVGQGD